MVIVLPFDAIVRILDRTAPGRVRAVQSRGTQITSEPSPPLAVNIVTALERANRDPTLMEHLGTPGGKYVGALWQEEFIALATWCRRVGLPNDATVVEEAIKGARE